MARTPQHRVQKHHVGAIKSSPESGISNKSNHQSVTVVGLDHGRFEGPLLTIFGPQVSPCPEVLGRLELQRVPAFIQSQRTIDIPTIHHESHALCHPCTQPGDLRGPGPQ